MAQAPIDIGIVVTWSTLSAEPLNQWSNDSVE